MVDVLLDTVLDSKLEDVEGDGGRRLGFFVSLPSPT